MLMQPNIFYLNLQIQLIKLLLKYWIYKAFLFSLRVRSCIVFQAVDLHNRRRGDRGPFQTQIPQQYRWRKESKERKKQARVYCVFWDHSFPFSYPWKDPVHSKWIKWLMTWHLQGLGRFLTHRLSQKQCNINYTLRMLNTSHIKIGYLV